MAGLTFAAVVELQGVNPYVLVTKERAAELQPGWRKPMPVVVQVNGQPSPAWHINMMPVGDGSFYLYLHGDVRKASKTKVGDTVEVRVSFDSSYKNGPMHPMPDWFREPLEADPKAKQAWDALPPSRQKEILRYLASLKSDEAKARNVAKALHVLSGNEDRFMARTWKNGA
ncbi:MAG TPA: YdeI/OmpD-associated family protein [Candidatus Pristimantibacillus sp.]|jgi:hypothetical protein|nr:YdeI/OmpD-associated family protein [Candidatus Pristimantibacillus sp.]